MSDIHLLRQIYSEPCDITYLINDIYGMPILATTYWILTVVLSCVYDALINFNERAVEDVTCVIAFVVLFFKVTFFCNTVTNEASLQEF